MSIVNPRSRIMDLMTRWTEISTRYNLEAILQQKKGMKTWREGLVKRFQSAASREDVTQTLEIIDPEAEAMKKDDVKFYEHLITGAGAQAPTSGKKKREKQSLLPIRTTTSHGKSGSFEGPTCWDLRRKATPFMSAKTLLKMRDRRFCNQGEKSEILLP